ncbi:polysaccharide biosynthesis tyrosine autokinase [Geofilum sp. OHC36d9]|uniref:polysaccharide biosynthesis tyrosine autokinase n=1 Tax=Geofilum sp. OHC36d9 TaxID=3458413 RepID=UPI004034B7CB
MASSLQSASSPNPLYKGSDGLSDIRKMTRLALSYWYLFVICFFLSLSAVWLYHRYTLPVYKASVTILFKDDSNQDLSRSVITEGFGLSAEMRSIENQSFIIRSHAMSLRAINRLDFGVSYYSKGRLKDSELYHPFPFVIRFDSVHPQLLNTPVFLKFLGDDKVHVSIQTERSVLHRYSDDSDVGYTDALNFETTVTRGEEVKHPWFKFSVELSETGSWPEAGEYYVKFNSQSAVASKYRSSLAVTPYSEGSSIVFVTVSGQQPQKLKSYLQVLAEEIVKNNLERKNDMANRSIDFIQSQLATVADTLSLIQQKLIDFRKSNRFMMPSEVSERLSDEFFEMEKERRMLDFQYDYLNIIRRRLKNNSRDENDFMLPAFSEKISPILQQFITEHLTLLKEYSLMEEESGASNPYITELEKKIEVSEQSLMTGIGKQMENIELSRDELDSHEAQLTSRISELPELERDFLALERTHKLNDAIYTFLLQKASENQIAKASNVPDNEVLDQAYVYGPILPDKKNDYTKGLLVGLLLPALIIGLKEFFNIRIRRKDDLQSLKLGLPLVGSILHNKFQQELVVMEQQNTFIGESFRSLRARLRFMLQAPGKVISVTSTNTGEGKTFCAVNLASVFAISGKKTILVGLDLRKPRLSPVFNLDKKPGVSNYLIGQAGWDDVLVKTDFDNLWVLHGGDVPPNPSELISGPATAELFKRLRQEFDIVIVDTPPVGLVSDARIVMDLSDCHLYIVRAGVTVKEHFETTIRSLIDEKVSCLGLVLNDVNEVPQGYGYNTSGYFSDGVKRG